MKTSPAPKPPQQLFDNFYGFPPNRGTLGGTAYFIVHSEGGLLVDCPHWHPSTLDFLLAKGGVKTLYITHRTAISNQVAQIQAALGCAIVIQEQEAYLMPEAEITTFRDQWQGEWMQGIWTPGFSPGSSCLYLEDLGGCLFTGRHLLPNQNGDLLALHTAKTFHWRRQLASIEKLQQVFSPDNLRYIFPSANSGFLRGTGYLDDAYTQLSTAIARSANQATITF